MGLERLSCVLQGKLSNYDTDLLRPIIHRAAEMFGVAYGDDPRTDVALRINADHVRAAAFLIHDGVMPSNEGRGYVLRKIMRRAIRNARMIGREEPYLYELTGFVADLMKPGYPEMLESIQRVARVVKDEEHRYATTFQVAEKVFLDEAKSAAGGVFPGAAAFKLYDTFGLALDEQEEMARERGLTIDHARLPGRNGEAADARARQLERRRQGADRVRSTRDLPADRIHRPRNAGIARQGCSRRRARWQHGAGLRPHAVLRRSRRPGRRHGRSGFAVHWRHALPFWTARTSRSRRHSSRRRALAPDSRRR